MSDSLYTEICKQLVPVDVVYLFLKFERKRGAEWKIAEMKIPCLCTTETVYSRIIRLLSNVQHISYLNFFTCTVLHIKIHFKTILRFLKYEVTSWAQRQFVFSLFRDKQLRHLQSIRVSSTAGDPEYPAQSRTFQDVCLYLATSIVPPGLHFRVIFHSAGSANMALAQVTLHYAPCLAGNFSYFYFERVV
jgi:hypothetical protein